MTKYMVMMVDEDGDDFLFPVYRLFNGLTHFSEVISFTSIANRMTTHTVLLLRAFPCSSCSYCIGLSYIREQFVP